VSTGRAQGALSIVLHTHMPYVEGYGTWPFGEEWLWEAIATSYLPLLDLLDEEAPITLSLTPVLCDQLEAAGIAERFERFIGEVRRETHLRDAAGLRAVGQDALAAEIDRSWGDYAGALTSLRARGGDLLGSLARHAQWTSSATHSILPLLATDAGVRMQVHTGITSHRRRFGEHWRGGFWLPECAYAPWLERALEDDGVSAVCVELTGRLGLGADEHLRPLATESGVLLAPIDRSTMSLVWAEGGYPAAGAYRDYHHHTVHHHKPWGNSGEAYDHAAAMELAQEHARDFVSRTLQRLRDAGERAGPGGIPGGGLVVCALDTELLGHWWYEGVAWLRAVVRECGEQGLELLRLDDALTRAEPVAIDSERSGPLAAHEDWAPSSWGRGGDLSTWSSPSVADMAFSARAAELRLIAAGTRASTAAVREMLALQCSDWAFLISQELAPPYGRERFDGHLDALRSALADGPDSDRPGPRNIAVDARAATLAAP
jgi:1,4-alpha-glucan branching enzyme